MLPTRFTQTNVGDMFIGELHSHSQGRTSSGRRGKVLKVLIQAERQDPLLHIHLWTTLMIAVLLGWRQDYIKPPVDPLFQCWNFVKEKWIPFVINSVHTSQHKGFCRISFLPWNINRFLCTLNSLCVGLFLVIITIYVYICIIIYDIVRSYKMTTLRET